jgi:transcriptional regulator with XRE-family HTH domain
MKRGLSLERLAKLSGVSKAMLGQIELGQSTSTVKTVWKTAVALGVPFAALIEHRTANGRTVLRKEESKVLASDDGAVRSRALFPLGQPRSVEFYQLRFAVGTEEQADAHAPGTRENIVVHDGRLEIATDALRETLNPATRSCSKQTGPIAIETWVRSRSWPTW